MTAVPSSLPRGNPLPQGLQGESWEGSWVLLRCKRKPELSMWGQGSCLVGMLSPLSSNTVLTNGEVLFLNSKSVVL